MGFQQGGIKCQEACRLLRGGQTVFYDEHALLIPDPDHSTIEERFIIMGLSSAMRALVVVPCFRKSGSSIRVISARRAGTKEQQPYWENKNEKRV